MHFSMRWLFLANIALQLTIGVTYCGIGAYRILSKCIICSSDPLIHSEIIYCITHRILRILPLKLQYYPPLNTTHFARTADLANFLPTLVANVTENGHF